MTQFACCFTYDDDVIVVTDAPDHFECMFVEPEILVSL